MAETMVHPQAGPVTHLLLASAALGASALTAWLVGQSIQARPGSLQDSTSQEPTERAEAFVAEAAPGPASAARPDVKAPPPDLETERRSALALSAATGVPLEIVLAMRGSGLGWEVVALHLGTTREEVEELRRMLVGTGGIPPSLASASPREPSSARP